MGCSVQAIGVLAQVLPGVVVEGSGVAFGFRHPVMGLATQLGDDRFDRPGGHGQQLQFGGALDQLRDDTGFLDGRLPVDS